MILCQDYWLYEFEKPPLNCSRSLVEKWPAVSSWSCHHRKAKRMPAKMNEAFTSWTEMLLKDRNLFIFDRLFSLILSFIKFIDYKNINQRKTNHRFNFGDTDILPILQQQLIQVQGRMKEASDGGDLGWDEGRYTDENGHMRNPTHNFFHGSFKG